MRTKYIQPSIYRHPQRGTYYVRWTQAGQRKWRALIPPGESCATSDPIIANRLYKLFLNDFYAGKVVPLADKIKRSFYLFCDEFLDNVSNVLSYNTYLCYKDALDKAKEIIGDVPLGHINSRVLTNYQTGLRQSMHLSIPTVNKHYRHLKAAINKAIDWEYMDPIKKKFPKAIPFQKRTRFLTDAQIRDLLSRITDDEFYDFCLFSLFTGLRSGEIIRLIFADINNPEGFIRIKNQKNKEESSHPINPMVSELVTRCRIRRTETDTLYRFQSVTTISHLYRKYADAAGLQHTRFHDLRHTYASHMVQRGESLKIIQELMRHKSFASTLEYAHLAPQHLVDASQRVGYGPIPAPPVLVK